MSLEGKGQMPMETLKLAARPAVLVLLWTVTSAYTISELSTVDPTLRAAQASAGAAATPPSKPVAAAAALSRRSPPIR
jgi:hypothetical protein